VLDNLPVGVMAAEAEGPVIAVDVTRVEAWRPRRVTTPGSWRARTRRLITGQDSELPRLAETMFRTLALGSSDTVAAAQQHADIVIRPVVERALATLTLADEEVAPTIDWSLAAERIQSVDNAAREES